MAVNLPPTGGGNQIFIDVVFRTFTEGLRQAGQAVRQAGTEPFTQFGRAQDAAARGQERLQQSFRSSMENLRAWESLVGRSERTLGSFVSTTERFVRGRGLQLTPEQERVFQNQRQQLQLMRESTAAFRDETREITANAAARARFAERLSGVQRLRAAGVPTEVADPMERRVLRAGVERGFADPQQVARLRQLEQEAARAGLTFRLLGEQIPLGRTVAWAAAFTLVYNAIRLVTGLITAVTIGAVQRLSDFQQRQIAIAAEIVNLRPDLPFSSASVAANEFLEALNDLQPGFIGTRTSLQEIFQATLRYFGEVDVRSEGGRRSFLAFANGIALSQIGINRAGSAFREVAALVEGVIRPGAQFLTLLAKIDPQIEEHIKLWRQEGTVIENVARLIPGFAAAAEQVTNTIAGLVNRLETNIDRILRRFAPGGLVTALLQALVVITGRPDVAVPFFELILIGGFTIAARRFAPRAAAVLSEVLGAAFVAAATGFNAIAARVGLQIGIGIGSAAGKAAAVAFASALVSALGIAAIAVAVGAALGPPIAKIIAERIGGFMTGPEGTRLVGPVGPEEPVPPVRRPEAISERAAELVRGGVTAAIRRVESQFGDIFTGLAEVSFGPFVIQATQELEKLGRSAEDQAERMESAFRRGTIGAEPFIAALRRLAAEQLQAAAAEEDPSAREQKNQQVLRTLRRVVEMETELAEKRRRRPVENLDILERSIRLNVELSDSIVTQIRLLDDLERVQRRRLELLQEEVRIAAVAAGPGGSRALDEARERVRRELESQSRLARDRELKSRELVRITEQAEVEIFRVGQRAFVARLLEIDLQSREELRRVEGSREATLALERKFAFQRLQVLKEALDAMNQAEAQAARDRAELILRPLEFRRVVGDFQAFFLQQAPSEETLGQLRARFGRLREIQEEGFAGQIEALERIIQRLPRTVEAAPLRLQFQTQLRDLIIQQAQAQSQLNQQERDALRIARDRNLDEEVRILERRLDVLARIGAPTARLAEVERQIGRAQQLRELRQFGRRELEEERRNVETLLRAPGVGAEERRDLLERLDIIREAAAQAAEEQQGAVQANQQTINRLNAIGQQVQATLKLISDESTNSARKAREEYEGLFTWLEGRLSRLVEVFRRAGGLTGRSFAEAFTEHFGRAFPRPEGPGATIGGAGGARPRGELPAPAPFLGGIGGGAPEMLPAPAGLGGPINVNLTSSGPPQAPVIMVGTVDITGRVSQATIDDLIAAVLGSRGDVGVQRERRNVPAGGSVV